jgi:DNA-binding NtrC family response regulator
VKALFPDALSLLRSYPFPGNVRELENLIEHAVMLTKGEVVLPETLSKVLAGDPSKSVGLPIIDAVFAKAKEHILALFEKQFLTEMLTRYRGNVTAAARASHMTRQNFQRLMKKYDIQAHPFRP